MSARANHTRETGRTAESARIRHGELHEMALYSRLKTENFAFWGTFFVPKFDSQGSSSIAVSLSLKFPMTCPQNSNSRRDTLARSATAWMLCSLASLPVVLGLCFAVINR